MSGYGVFQIIRAGKPQFHFVVLLNIDPKELSIFMDESYCVLGSAPFVVGSEYLVFSTRSPLGTLMTLLHGGTVHESRDDVIRMVHNCVVESMEFEPNYESWCFKNPHRETHRMRLFGGYRVFNKSFQVDEASFPVAEEQSVCPPVSLNKNKESKGSQHQKNVGQKVKSWDEAKVSYHDNRSIRKIVSDKGMSVLKINKIAEKYAAIHQGESTSEDTDFDYTPTPQCLVGLVKRDREKENKALDQLKRERAKKYPTKVVPGAQTKKKRIVASPVVQYGKKAPWLTYRVCIFWALDQFSSFFSGKDKHHKFGSNKTISSLYEE